MSARIYTGFWIDWNRDAVSGATLTLSGRHGALLLAFLAVFVTIVALRLWRILTFSTHQILSSDGAHDGVYYQRQYVLRNSSSPGDAAWQFIQQAWYWRKVADHSLWRTVPWVALSASYMLFFAAISILSSWIADGATEHRILKPQACGFFVPADNISYQELRTHENYEAANYARQCYGGNSTSISCDSLPVPSLAWMNSSVDCPFNASVCMDVPAFQMTTDLIDSHIHLGINEPEKNRIGFRRQTVCSPLITRPGFAEYIDGVEAAVLGWPDDVLIKYLYGSRGPGIEETLIYNNYSVHSSASYTVWPYKYSRGVPTVWDPVEALRVKDSDITILLIAPNSIFHLNRTTDPVFSATIELSDIEAYMPDRYVSPIACADRYQVCNPARDVCSAFGDGSSLRENVDSPRLDLNAVQRATLHRLAFIMAEKTFYDVMFTRTQSFLRAQDRVAGLIQRALPSNQWEVEMAALFSDTLSLLQHQMAAYPTGPPGPGDVTVVRPWEAQDDASSADVKQVDDLGLALEDLCRTQRVRSTQGTINFSVLGMGILLGFGLSVVALSFLIEPLVAQLRKLTGRSGRSARRWTRDEYLQTMRMLFEGSGAGEWEGKVGSFPRTTTAQWFEYDEIDVGQVARPPTGTEKESATVQQRVLY